MARKRERARRKATTASWCIARRRGGSQRALRSPLRRKRLHFVAGYPPSSPPRKTDHHQPTKGNGKRKAIGCGGRRKGRGGLEAPLKGGRRAGSLAFLLEPPRSGCIGTALPRKRDGTLTGGFARASPGKGRGVVHQGLRWRGRQSSAIKSLGLRGRQAIDAPAALVHGKLRWAERSRAMEIIFGTRAGGLPPAGLSRDCCYFCGWRAAT